MSNSDRPVWHFNLIAPWYDRVIPAPETDTLLRVLDLPASGWLLDAGGGTGRVGRELTSKVHRIVLCDLSMKMLQQTAAEPGLNPVQGRAELLPFPPEVFSRVFVSDALHHFGLQKQSLFELIRVLKPGGRLCIHEPDIQRIPVKIVAFLERLVGMRSRFLSIESIMSILEQGGATAWIETYERHSAWVVAEKGGAG